MSDLVMRVPIMIMAGQASHGGAMCPACPI